MNDEEGGADAPRQGRNTNRASMHDVGTRENSRHKMPGKRRKKSLPRAHVIR